MGPFRKRMGHLPRRIARLQGKMPLPPVSTAARAALRRLAQAHELLDRGAFEEAAAIFGELAEAAEAHEIPRAPQLHLQAGRAWLDAGRSDQAVERIRHGLRLMETHKQGHRLRSALPRIADELRSKGLNVEAESLEREFAPSLPAAPATQEEWPASRESVRLPSKCPYCGGTIRPSEVDWVGEIAVQCDYCGSVVEGQA